jgi:hypothetical protein
MPRFSDTRGIPPTIPNDTLARMPSPDAPPWASANPPSAEALADARARQARYRYEENWS